MSRKVHAPLRHPVLGVKLPYFDCRLVSIGTVMEYLERDYTAMDRLTSDGFFAGDGCTRIAGSIVEYCPARIWSFNHLVPDPSVIALLLAFDGVWSDFKKRIEAVPHVPIDSVLPFPTRPGAARRQA